MNGDIPTTNDSNTNTVPKNDNFILDIIVSDPQRQRDESGSFVNYQVSTKSNIPSYHENYFDKTRFKNKQDFLNNILVVHRRYSDFLLLHTILVNDYPSCIAPPIPDKKVLQYISGDRFSPSFTEKRCHSLQNFLQKLALHPTYSRSKVLETFLVSGSDWDIYRKSITVTNTGGVNVGITGNSGIKNEDVSDVLMNAFKHVRNQSEEFVEIKEKSEKLEYNIHKIDKVTHRVVKSQDSLTEDYNKLNLGLENLKELISKEEHIENSRELLEKLKIFNNGILKMTYSLRDLSKYYDYEYLVDLRDMEHYVDSLKQLLKLKDQKQIDYEELNDYLTKAINEKNNLISGYGGNFFTNKLEEIAGINQEASRREKIAKLETKINTLTSEVDDAKKIADNFEQEALLEVGVFEQIKNETLKKSLGNLADNQIEYYERLYQTWSEIENKL
ncbi:related to Sorting nexin-4 [Saccharomycodes ludwigii]|uniref:Sorting nexin-4 n=1 Tax=Saccharomycodes ludwigii TaxID=36035 RepID=A0A376B8F6_9ASCO|nr:hypothetical protein SCDLUD_004663 [Saccharomycodes ludwigii]KAH3899230.1 hypothetical protein SCDLUD_004663 [Saccharomycodes ludwigii]SSD60849.1 related to Sorting nexin-4 [Saccharomycodes ludwigii]